MTIKPEDAASELLARRRARNSLLSFTEYTYPAFQAAQHHQQITDALERVERGECKRLMIFAPPRHTKSELASRRFPAWYIGRNPDKQIITCTYSGEFATDFGREVKGIVGSEEYQRLFPDVHLAEDSKAKGRWHTNKHGVYVAVGVGGPITGRGAHLALIDDPIKNRQDADSETIRESVWKWYTSTLRTRLMPGGAIVLVLTRWHEDDLAGRLLEAQQNGGEQWEVINLPAIENGLALWPEWYPIEELDRIKGAVGPRDWLALYQQTPTAEEGTYFRREWFESRYTALPDNLAVYMSGDFAVTADGGDFTELAVWGVDPLDNIYVLDWWHGQTSSDVWINEMLLRFKRFEPQFFIGETGPIRRAVEPQLKEAMRRTRSYCALEWLSSGGNKEASARSFQALCAQGRVRFPLGQTWAERVIDQLLRFPAGKHDDAVDTCGLFGRFIHRVWSNTEPKPQPQLEDVWQTQLKVADFRSPKKAATW